MLCEKCGKREATVYYKSIVNGQQTQLHLCQTCAKAEGVMSDGHQSVNHLFFDPLGSFFGENPGYVGQKTVSCPVCGARAGDVARTGRAGCAECYTHFASLLQPLIRRIHGGMSHTGSVPGSAGTELQQKRRLETLRRELQEAIRAEEFEKAASLRDEINSLEKNRQKGDLHG